MTTRTISNLLSVLLFCPEFAAQPHASYLLSLGLGFSLVKCHLEIPALRLRNALIAFISFALTTSLRTWAGQTGHVKRGEGARFSGSSWARAVDFQCQVQCQLTPPSCLRGHGQSWSRTHACLSSGLPTRSMSEGSSFLPACLFPLLCRRRTGRGSSRGRVA